MKDVTEGASVVERRVLVVEDSPTQAELVCLLLERKGYRVTIADNGQKGLRTALSEPHDVVITDIAMPIMDGLEMTSRLKADPRTKDVPVLVLTVCDHPLDVVRCLSAGADLYLTKPCDEDVLLSRVESLVNPRAEYDDMAAAPGKELQRDLFPIGGRQQILHALIVAVGKIVDCTTIGVLVGSEHTTRHICIVSLFPLEPATSLGVRSHMAYLLRRVKNADPVPPCCIDIVVNPEAAPLSGELRLLQYCLHPDRKSGRGKPGLVAIFGARMTGLTVYDMRLLNEICAKAAEALCSVAPVGN